MKKHLSIVLTVAMITILFTGCSGSVLAVAPSSSAPKAKKTETTEVSAQEEKKTEAALNMEEVEVAEVSVQDEEKSAAPIGFQFLGRSIYDAEGRLIDKRTFYEGSSLACWIFKKSAVDTDGYCLYIFDREYDEEGKWIGTKNYFVQDITNIESINLDDYRIEENMVGTGVCKNDDNGVVVEESDLNGNLLQRSTYNCQGQLIRIEKENNGKVTYNSENTYNEQGVLVESFIKENKRELRYEYTPFGVTPVETLVQIQATETGDIEYSHMVELHYNDNGILTGGEKIENGEVTETYTF